MNKTNRRHVTNDVWSNERTLYIARQVGDANDDRVFDSSDLMSVFAKGEYDDGVANNSSFDEGDWNLDGEFNSSDLVLAFQLGTYHQTPPTIVAAAIEAMRREATRRSRHIGSGLPPGNRYELTFAAPVVTKTDNRTWLVVPGTIRE